MRSLVHHSGYLVIKKHARLHWVFLSGCIVEPFNAFLTLKQMKGSHTAQAIVAEYEHVVEMWKLPITKVFYIRI